MTHTNIFEEANFIKVNDITLEVFEAGKEHVGNPIVLCHGWPQSAYTWRKQVSALVAEGYHVIIPNQRGYGNSSSPKEVNAYDIKHLADDLVSLLDYYAYKDAIFVGHDWGATVVWGLTLLHPTRVKRIINLSVPYMERGEKPWVQFIEDILGPDNYMVHFNRYPGLADAVLDDNTSQFLRNMYRKNIPLREPKAGNAFINLANEESPYGDPIMNDVDLAVYVSAFKTSGFTGSINWYRNLDRNWHILEDVDPIIHQQALMIYGEQDMVQQAYNLEKFVPNVEIKTLDCGHWIQEEKPEETTQLMITWLKQWLK